jgi:hypothetical protein
MILTNDYLVWEKPHPVFPLSGVQRIYRFPSGYGLSVVNPPELHGYPFAWEVAVLKHVNEQGFGYDLDYTTPLTSDVEVFDNNRDTNTFIHKAIQELASSNPAID